MMNLLKQAQQLLREERQARIPNISLSGSYQRDAGREAYVGGVTLPLPLWYQREGDIAEALGVQHQIEADILQWKTHTIATVYESVEESHVAASHMETYEQGLLKQAQEAVRVARTSFRYGQASLLDVLDAQRILWETLVGYVQARFDLSISLTKLKHVVGTEL